MENYEQKYKELIEKLQTAKKKSGGYTFTSVIDAILPELKESEDEKIMKELLEHCINRRDGKQICVDASDYRRWAAWLEKQGKKEELDEASYRTGIKRVLDNPESYGLEKQGEQHNIWHVEDEHNLKAALGYIEDEYLRRWFKDIVYAKFEKQGEQKSIDLNTVSIQKLIDVYRNTDEYDEDGNLKGKPLNCMIRAYEQGIRDILKTIKQKDVNLTWSEEDEKRMQSCLNILRAKGIMGVTETINSKWLKSLKDRVQPQPKQEWSEEDEQNSAFIVAALDAYNRLRKDNNNSAGQKEFDRAVNWIHHRFKYLRPQPKQEWSEKDEAYSSEIIGFLKNYIKAHGCTAMNSWVKWLESLKPNHWKPSEQNIKDLEWCADLVKDKMGVGFHRLQVFIDELRNLES